MIPENRRTREPIGVKMPMIRVVETRFYLSDSATGEAGGDSLETRDQFVERELGDVDRRSNDLKTDALEHQLGRDRLVEDTSLIDERLDLSPDANKANGVPSLAIRGDHRIGESDVVPRLAVPQREAGWDFELNLTDELGFGTVPAVGLPDAADDQSGQFDKISSTVVGGSHGHRQTELEISKSLRHEQIEEGEVIGRRIGVERVTAGQEGEKGILRQGTQADQVRTSIAAVHASCLNARSRRGSFLRRPGSMQSHERLQPVGHVREEFRMSGAPVREPAPACNWRS